MSGLVGFFNDPVKIIAGADSVSVKEWTFNLDGNLQLPFGGNVLDYNGNIIISEGTGNITFDADTITNNFPLNPVSIRTNGLSTYVWTFESDGTFIIPAEGNVTQANSKTRTNFTDITSVMPTIVWSSISSTVSSAKLLIQLEQEQVGDPTGFHTHTCEAIISARGANQTGVPSMSVYGINYTSVSSLVSFSIQRNISNGIIELVATLNDTTNPAYVSVHSVESETRGL